MVAAGVVAVAPVALLSGCSWWGDGDSTPRPAATLSGPPKRAEEVWRVPISAAAQPNTARGVTAVFGLSPGGSLTVVVLDAKTGKTWWSRPASAGVVGNGNNLSPALFWDDARTYVGWLEPVRAKSESRDLDDGIRSRVVIADARTGKVLARSAAGSYSEPPEWCDSGDGVCTEVIESDGEQRPFQLGLPESEGGDGDLDGNAPSAPGGSVTEDGGGYVITDGRVPSLSHRVDDRILWTMPLTKVFGAAVDPQYLTVRQLDRGRDVVVLSLLRRLPDGRHDMSEMFTSAAVSGKGKVLWRAPGTLTTCMGFAIVMDGSSDDGAPAPQPTSSPTRGTATRKSPTSSSPAPSSPASASRTDDPDPTDPWVRCRYRASTVQVSEGFPALTKAAPPVVTIEGFDPVTGRTTWSWQVGRSHELSLFGQWETPVKIAGPTSFVVGSGASARILDVRTGRRTLVPPGGSYLCLKRKEFRFEERRWEGDDWERDGGLLVHPCSANGGRAPGLPDLPTLAAFGSATGGTVVLATDLSLVGYR